MGVSTECVLSQLAAAVELEGYARQNVAFGVWRYVSTYSMLAQDFLRGRGWIMGYHSVLCSGGLIKR